MRKPLTQMFLLLLLLAPGGCGSNGSEPGERQTPRDAMGRTPTDLVGVWVESWNSYDLDQVGELFLTDGRLTYFSSEFEGAIRGFDSVVEHHQGFGFVPGGKEADTRLWVEGLTEDVFGDGAVLTGVWYFERGGEAAVAPQRGPVTIVCVREDGRWRFAHMNFGNYLDEEGQG